MSKQSGLGDNFYIAGYNVSGDVNSLSRISGGPAALDVTPINKSAPERLGGKRDGGFTFTSIFNDATGQQHEALKTLPLASHVGTYFRGTAVGNPAASCMAKQIMYDGTRDAEGLLTFTADLQADGYGLQWGEQLTAGVLSTAVGVDGTALNTGASASFGAQVYLQIISFTGTNVFIGVNHSSDNGVGDPYAAIAVLEQEVTAGPADYRLTTTATATVKQYVRMYAAGTFSQVSFAMMIAKNFTATVF